MKSPKTEIMFFLPRMRAQKKFTDSNTGDETDSAQIHSVDKQRRIVTGKHSKNRSGVSWHCISTV